MISPRKLKVKKKFEGIKLREFRKENYFPNLTQRENKHCEDFIQTHKK